jgi:hypothetical protein
MPSVQVTFDGSVKFEVSGKVDLNIILPPQLQAFLDQMISTVPEVKEETEEEPEPEPEPEPEIKIKKEPELKPEPKESAKPKPTLKKKAGPKPKTQDVEWQKGPNNIKLVYRTEGEKLFLKYYSGIVQTTWTKMSQISNLSSDRMRKTAINKVLSDSNNKPITANKEEAVKLLLKCMESGLIEDPTTTFIDTGTEINPNLMSDSAQGMEVSLSLN